MAKRLNTSQSNTLFNYFKSPKAEKSDLKVCSTDDANNDSDEEIIKSTKKKRRRVVMDDSDSDTENIETPIPKKTKASAKENLKDYTFSKGSPSSKEPKQEKKVVETPKKSLAADAAKWLHEELDFLKPENIRDINKRKLNDPDYDARTLYVPDSYLNKLTPAMRQWWELKSRHMDSVLFFKVGKFYELYHMDATVGVDCLGFSYMKGEFAHSGFPESAYGRMAMSLIEQGFKVARVEQTETPDMMAERCKALKKTTKFDKVVKREICQISTKGTLIYSAQLTDAKQSFHTYMTVICEKIKNHEKRFGVCFIDTSIGTFHLSEFNDDMHYSRLLVLLSQHSPALIITERKRLSFDTSALLKKHLGNIRWDTLAPDTQFCSASTTLEKLASGCYFKNSKDDVEWPEIFTKLVSDGSPKPDYELALKSLGGALWYLKDCEVDIQVLSMRKFEWYDPVDTSKVNKAVARDYMILDSVTMNNLKILGGAGTLQKTLDYCMTPFGKRLLQQWICRPLCEVSRIKERQNAVKELLDKQDSLRSIREILTKLPDLERQITKIHNFGNKYCSILHPDSRAVLYEGKTYAKRKILDLLSLLEGYEKCMEIPNLFKHFESRLIRKLTQFQPVGMFCDLTESLEFIKDSFDHKQAKEDGVIIPRAGVDDEYDSIQDVIKGIQDELDEYLQEQRKYFRCEVNYFGNEKKRYQLEIPDHKRDKVTREYSLESTKKGSKPAKRYSTSVTKELLARMIRAESDRTKILEGLNRKIFERFSSQYIKWEQVLQCVMILDCLCCLAEYARIYSEDSCLPTILPFSDNPICKIENGRHPCIASINNFVPNDSELGTEGHGNILILTGPNMGGKSTLMRQVVLISIMAQIGSYVPASYCELSLIDRIFTRLGAHDDILKHQSTFLVELIEASSILQHATKNSFILLDELGRGTSTHDGNAIATGYVSHLCKINCRTIFSTHYHSLVEFFNGKNDIQLGYMMCMVENEDDAYKERVTFLYKLAKGLCPKSYGFNVAKLAGLPRGVVLRARAIASEMEKSTRNPRIISVLLDNSPQQIRHVLGLC